MEAGRFDALFDVIQYLFDSRHTIGTGDHLAEGALVDELPFLAESGRWAL